MKRNNRGRGRRRGNKRLPPHIIEDQLPKNCYWDSSGNGYWYTLIIKANGKKGRKKIAGPSAKMSDLHRALEQAQGIDRNTFRYLAQQFHDSQEFKQLAPATRKDYEKYREVILNHPTKTGGLLGDAPYTRWSKVMVQRLIDQLTEQRGPSAAAHALRYLRRTLTYATQRIEGVINHAAGVKAPKERKRQRLPSVETYTAVLKYAQSLSGYPYLWIFMEIAWLARLRPIETLTLSDANELKDGLLTNRRKQSRDNIVEWSPRLLAAFAAAKELRAGIRKKRKLPVPISKEHAWLFIGPGGDHIKKDTLDTAWGRLMRSAIADGAISSENRFGPHDLKRFGISQTEGNRAEKQEASGHKNAAMLDVYDKSIPKVPAADQKKNGENSSE